ncbi:MAG: autotransporter-associated beta strand repeat-containing protein [Pirellulales bacterium]
MGRLLTIRSLLSTVALVPLALFAMLPARHAASQTWTGAGANSAWSTAENWSSGAPLVSSATTAVVFDGSSSLQLSNVLSGSYIVKSLTFTAGQTTAVTISTTNTQPLVVASGTVVSSAAGAHRFVGSNGGSGAAADWRFTGGSGSAYTFDIADGSSFEVAGRFSNINSGTSGSTTNRLFTKTGGGTLILAGDNGGSGSWNFSGGRFTVAQGAVRLTVANALGNSGDAYTVSPGGSLEFSFPGTAAAIGQVTGSHIVSGSGVAGAGALRTLSGTVTLTGGAGSIALPAAAAFGVDSGKMTVGHVMSGVGSLTKVGAGVLQLNSAANSYSGGTLVSDGLLIVSNSTAIGPGPLTIQGGSLDILASGAGDLALGAAAPFTMTSGTLNLLLGTVFDRILGSGGATFATPGGTLALDVTGTGFDYAAGYQIFSGFSSGTAAGVAISGYDTSAYTALLSDSGLLSFSAVPEPASLAMVGLATAASAHYLSRRRRHRRC